jgi:hypothetical protein
VDLDYLDTLDENSIEVIELLIEFSDKCHEWYLDSYVLAYFINNKRCFKNYRLINNYIILTVISYLLSIKKNLNNLNENIYFGKNENIISDKRNILFAIDTNKFIITY